MKRLFRLPLTRDRVMGDVKDELSFHLEGRVEELMAGGLSRGDAEREALRRFGDRERVEEEVERIDVTTFTRRRWREGLAATIRDARYGVRALVRRPLFALTVVATLALGIGANTAIFSVFDAVLLHPFAAPDIGRLAVVHDDFPLMNLRSTGVSPAEALDLRARTDLFSAGAAYGGESVTVEVAGASTRVVGAKTFGDFFALFGTRPLRGRLYGPDESAPDRANVVVLTHRFWQQLSGDTAILGRRITLNDVSYEVVGILAPGVTFPRTALYYRPYPLEPRWSKVNERGTLITTFIGRVRGGVTFARLDVELRALAARWHEQYPDGYGRGGHTMFAESFVASQAGKLRPIVIALLVAVGLVLLIACANVASLQMVRSAARARELAVRAALGAGRGAIASQLIVESGLLALAGGVAGVALGKLGLRALARADLAQFPALKDLNLNGTVLAFTAIIVVLAALLVGAAPAWRAARADVSDALRDSSRGSSAGASRHQFLRTSVVVQNAVTVLLLVGAGLTLRSLDRLLGTDPGFQPDHVVSFTLVLPTATYKTGEQRLTFFRTVEERLRAIPGVQSVGFALGVPFTGGAGSTSYKLTGVPEQPGEPQRHANQAFVFGDFFRTMGIAIVRGRAFSAQDQLTGPPTVVVDETLVHQSFGAADPIGVEIEHGPSGTIIGVARPVKLGDLAEPEHPLVYHDWGHRAGEIAVLTAVVRSSLSTEQALKASAAAVAEIDPRLPVGNGRALSDRLAESLGPRRLLTYVLAGFAVLSFLLALLGVYAVMSYVVNERRKEIGIRVALGAQRAQIMTMVLRDGITLALLGVALGGAAFLGLGRLMQGLLYGVGVLDPLALGVAVGLLGAVTLVACYLPARRAVKVDPVVTLRSE